MSISVTSPFSIFADTDGELLDDGFIYIGTAGLNPIIEANRVAIYSDSGLTIPMAQPVRTLGGYPVNSGSPTQVFAAGSSYSIVVLNSHGELVYVALNSQLLFGAIDFTNIIIPQTTAEATAGVTPTNYYRFPLDVRRYGATGDGLTDDRPAVQKAVDVAAVNGGKVTFGAGDTYRLVCGGTAFLGIQACVVVKDNVELECRGATLNMECGTGAQTGVWLYRPGAKVTGGKLNLLSSGSPSSQGFFHACVAIGLPNNCGDNAASPDAAQFMYNWEIVGNTMTNNRAYHPCIQGMGGINNGLIRGNYFPDSTTATCIHFDWGNTGVVSSADIPTTRTSFNAGSCYTTHPHSIRVIDNKCGIMSVATSGDIGSFAVRVSAVYNIEVDGFEIESVNNTGYAHTGGDLGFEFARPEDKRHAYQGNICRRMSIRNASASLSQGAVVDTLGDNVYREQFISGYSPLANPLWHGNVLIEDCDFPGANTDNTYGVRIIQARGVRVFRCNTQRWKHGILVDEFTQDIDIIENLVIGNRSNGIHVGFAMLREDTARITIMENKCYGNGTAGSSSGIAINRVSSAWVSKNTLGVPGEAVQVFGLVLADTAGANSDIHIFDNRCAGAVTAGYSLQSGTPTDALMYRVLATFRNNTAGFGVPLIEGGQTHVTIGQRTISTSRASEFMNPNSSAPSDGTWYRGDNIWQATPLAASKLGDSVTTAGTFGTLAAITNGSTTNGSATFTCSLTGITVNTTAQTYQVVVSSATGVRAGMKCSIAAAGITDAKILSVSGTTLQLDTQATSTQVAAAFTATGLIEGEVISINTTTPKSGMVILKITGTNVTTDTTLVDTQAGRTITYTTPVFKAWAAIAV